MPGLFTLKGGIVVKEYEYVVEALEGYLCDELTGVICSENYRNKSYGHGYRHIFVEYRKLHEDFCAHEEIFADLTQEKNVKEEFQHQCEKKREDVRVRFFKDIQACTKVDIEGFMDNYLKKLAEEDVKTTAKRICLYPYLVAVLRAKGGKVNGEEF